MTRLRALAALGAVATLTATALTAALLPADGAAPPRPVEYVKHTVYADLIVAGATPGRTGNFHTIDVSGGIEVNFPLGPEQTSWVSVVGQGLHLSGDDDAGDLRAGGLHQRRRVVGPGRGGEPLLRGRARQLRAVPGHGARRGRVAVPWRWT